MMMTRTDRLPDAPTRGQRRIFTVQSRLVTIRGKTIRHIVIWDNHPDSLRLLLSSDLISPRRNEFFYAVLTSAAILATGLGILWPLP